VSKDNNKKFMSKNYQNFKNNLKCNKTRKKKNIFH